MPIALEHHPLPSFFGDAAARTPKKRRGTKPSLPGRNSLSFMGEHPVDQQSDDRRVGAFMKALLADLRALEVMLETGRFESGVRRIGAEQEMFLVDREMRPAPVAADVLKRVADPRLTTEIARFNLEANLTPRSRPQQARQFPTRVGFGEAWVQNSVLELFREDIARFRVILTTEQDEDPLEVLKQGGTPQLRALRLHNGTVWWWNRPCYGISEGRAHLRIENRVLPAGPTPLDEMANAAFFIGLMSSLRKESGDIERRMSFDDAKANFFAAARNGLNARFTWVDGESVGAPRLILERLLPLARAGLKRASVDSSDAERYLGVIEERVRSGRTGAQWTLQSLAAMDGRGTGEMRCHALARAMHERQQSGEPVHRWRIESDETEEDWSQSYRTVGQFMSRDLFTVRPEDLVDFAASVMTWRHIRHVPVEDDEGRLVGLVSHRDLLRLLGYGLHDKRDPVSVREIMKANPLTVAPDTPTLEAIEIMRRERVGCLPVVERGTLVGIVTAQDFLAASARLFEMHMKEQEESETQAASSSTK